jgi:hypothetical protein
MVCLPQVKKDFSRANHAPSYMHRLGDDGSSNRGIRVDFINAFRTLRFKSCVPRAASSTSCSQVPYVAGSFASMHVPGEKSGIKAAIFVFELPWHRMGCFIPTSIRDSARNNIYHSKATCLLVA